MKKRNFRITMGEKMLIFCFVFMFLFTIVTYLLLDSKANNLMVNNEKLNYKLKAQEKVNESLEMQVNELTSYDTIKGIVEGMGLSYNNENIIVVTE